MPMQPVISLADAPVFDVPGIRFTGLASPSRGSAESAVWMFTIAPGTPSSPHELSREEIIVVIEGLVTATIGDREFEVGAGSAIIVPAFTNFALANPFHTPCRAVAVLPVGATTSMGGNTFVPPWAA
ncbi:MAG: cupin domain-containing protein [Gemmatimonas sp.]